MQRHQCGADHALLAQEDGKLAGWACLPLTSCMRPWLTQTTSQLLHAFYTNVASYIINPALLRAPYPACLQLDKKLRGCFVYTSSAAAMIPNPFSVLYSSTKSFLSSFGASLAAEVSSGFPDQASTSSRMP